MACRPKRLHGPKCKTRVGLQVILAWLVLGVHDMEANPLALAGASLGIQLKLISGLILYNLPHLQVQQEFSKMTSKPFPGSFTDLLDIIFVTAEEFAKKIGEPLPNSLTDLLAIIFQGFDKAAVLSRANHVAGSPIASSVAEGLQGLKAPISEENSKSAANCEQRDIKPAVLGLPRLMFAARVWKAKYGKVHCLNKLLLFEDPFYILGGLTKTFGARTCYFACMAARVTTAASCEISSCILSYPILPYDPAAMMYRVPCPRTGSTDYPDLQGYAAHMHRRAI
eukprot:1156579-Pelagomonas_calceolata.AAC.1